MNSLPLLSELIIDVLTDIETQYGITISDEIKVALRAIGLSEAGVQWLQYKQLGFIQKQIWPDTADTEAQGGTLERFGRTRLRRNPFPAVAGQYLVTVTGSIGATIPAQSTFKSDDTALNPGFLFTLDSVFTLLSTTATITLRALTPGTDSKLAIGNTLTSTSPIPLVNNPVTVSAEAVQPLAAESIEDYRQKTLDALILEAQGGAATDYRIWAQNAQGVKQVYPYANPDVTNSNNIYIEATVVDSTDGKGTPSQAMLNNVEAVINFNPDSSITNINESGRRPNTVIEFLLPITPLNVDIVIAGSTFTAAQKTLITTALTNAINLIRPYLPAADIPSRKNDIISVNNINGVIYSQIPAAVYTGVTLSVSGTPLLTYTFTAGNIPFVNTVTFT